MRPLPTLAATLLAGCAAASSAPNAGTEQLRAQQARALERAGISEACIEALPLSVLGEVKGITAEDPKTSREVLIQRQRIRTAAGRVCADI